VKPLLLIVDDDEDIRTQMKWALGHDYEIVQVGDRAGAVGTALLRRPDVILLDLGLPPHPNSSQEGLQALGELLGQNPATKVIIISGQGDKENALRAVGQGAYDFLSKPIDIDDLKVILKRAFHVAHLEREYRDLQQKVSGNDFEGMIGTSPQMQHVFQSIRKVATADAPVLLLGESGTGKEMAAMAIHRQSMRRDGPFVAINCHAIPETLLESELFGHEKGAFTGAHMQRIGRIEMASGGTLFLDEIGELSPSLQVKLLRFLQEQRMERVGGRQEIEVDTRIVAATNADLKAMMNDGRFREDLYFRLAVVVVRLPPLREREGDIPLLAKAFLDRYRVEYKKDITGFSARALQSMESNSWPGNVREMENRVKRAVIMAEGKLVSPVDLELDSPSMVKDGTTLKEAREALERDMVKRALARSKGNISRAAGILDVSRPTFYELMEKLGIKKDATAD
jgi:two-component system NtrC family response regulator